MFLKRKMQGSFITSVKALLISGLIVLLSCGAWTYSFAGNSEISQQSMDMLSKIGQATAELVGAVRPAVVNISITKTVKTQGGANPFLDDPFFRRFFGDQFKMPKERKSANLGSGVIVDPTGYILTANHVIQGADEIKVTLSDKREFKGKIVGNDAMTDIGIIKIEADNLPTIKWGDSDALRVGETVLAIGSPYGLSQTVTMGIVSAVGRANVGIADYEDFIQTDAAINPGNSGGALVNVKGELVGINTAIFSTSGGYQGIGFAVPTNMAKTVMDSLRTKGKVTRGWLGVTIQSLTPDLAKQFNLKEEKGVLVGDVVESGPAEKAGLQRGDVIIEFDGKKIEEPTQLRNMVANTPPNKEISLKIIRENTMEIKKATISELPADMQKSSKAEYNNLLKGVSVQELTLEMSGKLRLPKKLKGVIVSDVDEDSNAATMLLQGDVIQEINRQKITNVVEYEKVVSRIKPESDILLLVFRGGSSLYITLSDK
ncbi:MAG: DegQ family serine endoprotease [Nitrospira sp.]|nr:DegQ family serine endoprotease [Nitrospira sp.]